MRANRSALLGHQTMIANVQVVCANTHHCGVAILLCNSLICFEISQRLVILRQDLLICTKGAVSVVTVQAL